MTIERYRPTMSGEVLHSWAKDADETIDTVREAIREYYYALDSRKHGDIAAHNALSIIEHTLGMHWVRGAEKERRERNNG